MHETVVITTAICPPRGVPYLQMTDKYRRTIATRFSVFFWASQQVKNLVVVDATDSLVLDRDEARLLEKVGVNLEQLRYKQNEEDVRTYGKGHGEGLLIDFAVRHSELLSKSDSFFKCTGKMVCRNINAIHDLIKTNNLSSAFWLGSFGGLDLRFVDLRFFYTQKEFFTEVLLPGYLRANDSLGRIAEATCTAVINENLPRGWLPRPRLSGFSGGFDNQLDETNLGDLEYRFPCWLK